MKNFTRFKKTHFISNEKSSLSYFPESKCEGPVTRKTLQKQAFQKSISREEKRYLKPCLSNYITDAKITDFTEINSYFFFV